MATKAAKSGWVRRAGITCIVVLCLIPILMSTFQTRIVVRHSLVFDKSDVQIDDLMESGPTDVAIKLLNAHPELIKTYRFNKMSVLHIAASKGRSDLVRYLIHQGAEVDLKGDWPNGNGPTALYYAIASGDAATVKLLLANGADPNAMGAYSESLTDFAQRIHPELLPMIIAASERGKSGEVQRR